MDFIKAEVTMQTNYTHQARRPKNHNGWDEWENIILKQCCGKLTKEQIANMLTFLGSKRNPSSVARQASLMGRSLRILV